MNTTPSKSAQVNPRQWSAIRAVCFLAAGMFFVFSVCLATTGLAQEADAASNRSAEPRHRQDLKIRTTNIHGKAHPSEDFSAYLIEADGTHRELDKHPHEEGVFVAEQLPTDSYSIYIRGPETVAMHRFFFQATPQAEATSTAIDMPTVTIPTAMLSTRRLHQLVERYMVQTPVLDHHEDRQTFVNQQLSPTLPTQKDFHVQTDRSLRGIVVGPTKSKGESKAAHRANVLLLRGDVITSRTTTDEDGAFFFETVRPGVSTLAVFHQSGAAIVPLHVKRNGLPEQAPNMLKDLPRRNEQAPFSLRMPSGQLRLVTRQSRATVKQVAAVIQQAAQTPSIQINLANVGQSFQPLQDEVSGSSSSWGPTSVGGAAAAAGGLAAGGGGGAAAGGAAGVGSIGASSVVGLSSLFGEGEGIASPDESSPAVP